MTKNRCCCKNKHFENVDVTSSGSTQKKYFTRCTKCGLVVAVYGCESKLQMLINTINRILRWGKLLM